MPRFDYVVTVTADDQASADQIMAERMGYDEDLSEIGIGDYAIEYEEKP
jgi:hypothetical protein